MQSTRKQYTGDEIVHILSSLCRTSCYICWCFTFWNTQVNSQILWGSCCLIFSFLCSVLYFIVCPFVVFLVAIVLSVLRFMASDYPFGIFKFFSYHQPWQPSWIIDGIYGHNFETNHPRRIWTKIGFIPSSGSGEDFQRKSHGTHFGCRKRSPGKIFISKFGPI